MHSISWALSNCKKKIRITLNSFHYLILWDLGVLISSTHQQIPRNFAKKNVKTNGFRETTPKKGKSEKKNTKHLPHSLWILFFFYFFGCCSHGTNVFSYFIFNFFFFFCIFCVSQTKKKIVFGDKTWRTDKPWSIKNRYCPPKSYQQQLSWTLQNTDGVIYYLFIYFFFNANLRKKSVYPVNRK